MLRRATSDDVAAIAALFRRVAEATRPYRPELHTPEEDRDFFGASVASKDVWIAEEDGALAGFISFSLGWVHHLFIDVGQQGRGVGSALLDLAKAENDSLRLWVFQENIKARCFYEQRGFRLVRETDGAENEEKQPDALLESP
jgi:GNAT superfamily N-acetyltransferase